MLWISTVQRSLLCPRNARCFKTKSDSGMLLGWKQKGQKGLSFLLGVGCSLITLASVNYATAQEMVQDEQNSSRENQSTCTRKDLTKKKKLKKAIAKSILKLEQIKEEIGSPGLVCAVSIDGEVVLNTAMGFADVENGLKCHQGTLMRIASISKALTSIALGKLIQEMKLQLDVPIQQYVDYFPEKEFDGVMVTITPRMLMSHTSGVRHYEKELPENKAAENEASNKVQCEAATSDKGQTSSTIKKASDKDGDEKESNSNKSIKEKKQDEFLLKEYYIKEHYKTIKDAIEIFKDDPLLKKPGTDYLYTTHGWALLSACIEKASGIDYVTYMKNLCYELGLDSTVVELNDPITYHRSRNYTRDSNGKLQNTPYVDNSYKWAGGGFLSTVRDLTKIGHVMLYSYQNDPADGTRKGFLNNDVIKKLWTPDPATIGKMSKYFKEMGYGLGWTILSNTSQYGCCRKWKFAAMHGGGAVGASSFLLIVPNEPNHKGQRTEDKTTEKDHQGSKDTLINQDQGSQVKVGNEVDDTWEPKPKGVVVAIIANIQGVSFTKTALEIADNFLIDIE